jgi:hypothetical protein
MKTWFKKFIKEDFEPNLKPWMLQTKPEIEKWLKDNRIDGLVSKELEVHITRGSLSFIFLGNNDFTTDNQGRRCLPVQFYIVKEYDMDGPDLESFVGSPIGVFEKMTFNDFCGDSWEGFPKFCSELRGNPGKITSFEGFPTNGVKSLKLFSKKDEPQIPTLEGLPDNIKEFATDCVASYSKIDKILPNLTFVNVPKTLKDSILGILLLEHLSDIGYNSKGESKACRAATIVNDHYFSGDRDILDCKSELIEKGLSEYAKL